MQITMEEIRELTQPKSPHAKAPSGKYIVVLDRGFVYVGDVTVDGDWLTIANAKNIRVWGTTKGLGELRNGPTESTKLDDVGTVIAPLRAVIHLVLCVTGW